MTETNPPELEVRVRSLEESRFRAMTLTWALGAAAAVVAGFLGVTQYSLAGKQEQLAQSQRDLSQKVTEAEAKVSASLEQVRAAEKVAKSVLEKVSNAEAIASSARDTATRLAEEAQRAATVLDKVETALTRAGQVEQSVERRAEDLRQLTALSLEEIAKAKKALEESATRADAEREEAIAALERLKGDPAIGTAPRVVASPAKTFTLTIAGSNATVTLSTGRIVLKDSEQVSPVGGTSLVNVPEDAFVVVTVTGPHITVRLPLALRDRATVVSQSIGTSVLYF